MTKVESCIDHVDTPKRYESNCHFHNCHLEVLHGVVESNKVEEEERALIITSMVLEDSNEKDEEHEPSMKEDKYYKGENVISDLGRESNIASLYEVCLIAQSPAYITKEVEDKVMVERSNVDESMGASKIVYGNIHSSL